MISDNYLRSIPDALVLRWDHGDKLNYYELTRLALIPIITQTDELLVECNDYSKNMIDLFESKAVLTCEIKLK